MLQAQVIGNVGADAVLKNSDGNEFYSFRVAHNNRYTKQNGSEVSETIWIDCILPKDSRVAQFVKAGTLVFISGSVRLRVYSSEKDRCMKAGMTINVRQLELLSSKSDPVPSRLYDTNGVQHDVMKYFHTDMQGGVLYSQSNGMFLVDDNGWVVPATEAPADVQSAAAGSSSANNNATGAQSQSTQQPNTDAK